VSTHTHTQTNKEDEQETKNNANYGILQRRYVARTIKSRQIKKEIRSVILLFLFPVIALLSIA
jgi:hypothetical protein